MRTVLFFRNYKAFHGGHLKVWNYFNHVLNLPDFAPRIWFSDQSELDGENPWRDAHDVIVDQEHPIRPDVYFVGGANWRLLDRYPDADPSLPVINLIQHVRHVDPDRKLAKFLKRKAIRICVSAEVADELRANGSTTGPLIVIPNAIDLADLPAPNGSEPQVDVLIAAGKEPEMGIRVADRLAREGRVVNVLLERIPRREFLDRMRGARITVYLPHETEGFFLPALEGMALGTLVVCPDCIGNRSFCLPGHNAYRPNYTVDDVVRDTEAALALPPDRAEQLRETARRTADEHSLSREREAFWDVLQNVDQLWEGTNAVREQPTTVYEGVGPRSARP